MNYRIYVNGRPVRQTVSNPDNNINISLPETETLKAASISFTINNALRSPIPGVAVDESSGIVYVNLQQEKKTPPTPIVVETDSEDDDRDFDRDDEEEDNDSDDYSDLYDEPRRKNGCLTAVIITLIIAVIVLVAYYYLVYSRPSEIQTIEVPVAEPSATATAAPAPAVNQPAEPEPQSNETTAEQTETSTPPDPSPEDIAARKAMAESAAEEAYAQLKSLNLSFSDIPGLQRYGDNPDVSEQLRYKIDNIVSLHYLAIDALHSANAESYVLKIKDAVNATHSEFPELSKYLLSRIATHESGHLKMLPDDEIAKHFSHDKRCQTYR